MTEHRPDRAIALAASLVKIQRADRPYFVCPDCGRFSAHPDDALNSYCGHCHQFKFMSFFSVRCFEPTCPHFGDLNFGGSCPQEHEVPPARRGPGV